MELSTNKHNCTPLTKKTGLFVGGANKILQIEPTTFGNIPVKYLAENIVAKVGDLIFDSVSGKIIASISQKLVSHVPLVKVVISHYNVGTL